MGRTNLNTEQRHHTRKWIGVGAAVAAAAIAALAYFLPRDEPAKSNVEVTAKGENAIAAGRDVTIKERSTVDTDAERLHTGVQIAGRQHCDAAHRRVADAENQLRGRQETIWRPTPSQLKDRMQ